MTAEKTCFIAMPITTRDDDKVAYGDDDHWKHVMDSLFIPAVAAAGYAAIPPVTKGSHLIHADIIARLSRASMVLCDLSSHNPNVFFELGVRTSLNLPITLVRDELSDIPFDTSGLNTHMYKSSLNGWDMTTEIQSLTSHILESEKSCRGENPLWRQFGLTLKAEEPESSESPSDAKLDLLVEAMRDLRRHMNSIEHRSLRSDPDYPLRVSTLEPAELTSDMRFHYFSNEVRHQLNDRLIGLAWSEDGVIEVSYRGRVPTPVLQRLSTFSHELGLAVRFVSDSKG